MKYRTAVAFRTALEQRIRHVQAEQGVSYQRIRKLIVFDRFLARLLAAASDGWVLKGGVALNLRWGQVARTTRDLDLGRQDREEDATQHLVTAASMVLDDFFVFSVERTAKLDAMREGAAVRHHVAAELAGRQFDDITVDVGFGDPLIPEPEFVLGTALLDFAGIDQLRIPVVALEQHIAEKIHAYSRQHESGGSTRVKDLIDLVIIEQHDMPHAGRLRAALASTFARRSTHPLPSDLPRPPADWAVAYRRLPLEIGVPGDGGPIAMEAGSSS